MGPSGQQNYLLITGSGLPSNCFWHLWQQIQQHPAYHKANSIVFYALYSSLQYTIVFDKLAISPTFYSSPRA